MEGFHYAVVMQAGIILRITTTLQSKSTKYELIECFTVTAEPVAKSPANANNLKHVELTASERVFRFELHASRSYKDGNGKVTFGPKGQIGTLPSALQGKGIGRYCMSLLIQAAQERFKGFAVTDGMLSDVDARTSAKRENRDGFYRKLGFEIIPASGASASYGSFRAASIDSLTPGYNSSKIAVVHPSEGEVLLAQRAKLESANSHLVLAIEELRNRLDRKSFIEFWSVVLILAIGIFLFLV